MFTTLIQPVELNTTTQMVFDCRARLGELDWGFQQYLSGHIPGAQHLDLDRDLAAQPGNAGRHPLPDPEQLSSTLRQKGLNRSQQVVVYDDAGGAFAARAWWCLRWLGHKAVAVLDGGLSHWQQPLTQGAETTVQGNFVSAPALTQYIDADSLLASLANVHLIDARTEARFAAREEPIDKIAGHIPGAVCHPFQNNLDNNGRFLGPSLLADLFPNQEKRCIAYCGSGVTAAHNILAMVIAGCEEPTLYPGSWSEWIEDPGRPRSPESGAP